MMLLAMFLIAGLIAPSVLPAPTPGNTWGSGGGPPPGYYTVENFCSAPAVLYCCNGTGLAGAAGEPTATETGCIQAMAGNPPSVTYEFGFCPSTGGYQPLCCSVFLAEGIVSGCGLPTQLEEPSK